MWYTGAEEVAGMPARVRIELDMPEEVCAPVMAYSLYAWLLSCVPREDSFP